MIGLLTSRENDVTRQKRATQRAICSTPCRSTSTTDTMVLVQAAQETQLTLYSMCRDKVNRLLETIDTWQHFEKIE